MCKTFVKSFLLFRARSDRESDCLHELTAVASAHETEGISFLPDTRASGSCAHLLCSFDVLLPDLIVSFCDEISKDITAALLAVASNAITLT